MGFGAEPIADVLCHGVYVQDKKRPIYGHTLIAAMFGSLLLYHLRSRTQPHWTLLLLPPKVTAVSSKEEEKKTQRPILKRERAEEELRGDRDVQAAGE